jgi:PhnB protein
MSTSHVAPGYHTVQPALTVRGAAKAIEFYVALFGAVEVSRMPQPGSDKLMHAEIRIGDSVVMLSDEFDQWNVHSPQKYGGSPVSLMVYVPDVDALFARATAAGCRSISPPADMFWGDRYGKFTDPFGHAWGVATHRFDPTPEQLAEGAKAFGS